jgi:hypothetical protein
VPSTKTDSKPNKPKAAGNTENKPRRNNRNRNNNRPKNGDNPQEK